MNSLILAARDKVTGMPENFGGLEWKDVTNIHPIGLAATFFLGLALLWLPRRWAVLPMLMIACFVPSVQKVVALGLDFTLLRIMVIIGIFRLFFRKEYVSFLWKPLDKIMVLWIISSVLIHTIQQGTSSAFVNRLGFAFDAFGMYFLFRCLVQDWQDIETVVFGTLLISLPLAAFFLLENRTGRNLFSVFGGVPEITVIRDDRLRCQGAFSHPILAGCFWASWMPLFAAFWWKSRKDRVWALIGLISSSTIVLCSASSTPVMGVLMGIVGGMFFYLRCQMRLVRWGILLILAALHAVMNKPVWHLLARIDFVGGSTGYHRYMLVDGAIKYFNEWALVGTQSTLHWGEGALDITNQFILEGVNGGFLTFCLFIGIIVIAFCEVGKLWRRHIQIPEYYALSWSLGVSLFVHCMNFIGVSYFGQIWIAWYLLLAMIGCLSVAGNNPINHRAIRVTSKANYA